MADDMKAAIFVAEDSTLDQMMLCRAFNQAGILVDLHSVDDNANASAFSRNVQRDPLANDPPAWPPCSPTRACRG